MFNHLGLPSSWVLGLLWAGAFFKLALYRNGTGDVNETEIHMVLLLVSVVTAVEGAAWWIANR